MNLKDAIKELSKYLICYKLNLFVVFISLIAVSGSLLMIGYLIQLLVDQGLSNKHVFFVNRIIIFLVVFIICFAVASFFRLYFINLVMEKVAIKIKTKVYNHLLSIDLEIFEELKVADILFRFSHDIANIKKLINNLLSFFIRNFFMMLGGIVFMFLQSPKMSALIIIIFPMLLLPLLKFGKYIRKLSKQSVEKNNRLVNFIEESFSGIKTLHSYNKQQHHIDIFSQQINSYMQHNKIRLKARSLFFALAIAVITGSIVLVLWFGSIDIVKGYISSGEMVSFIYYVFIVAISIASISELFSEMHVPLASFERVLDLLNIKKTKFKSRALSLSQKNDSIEFKNVSFFYPSRPNIEVLKDISFVIESGKFNAIVGKSGSGKSTIMQLLMKFYQYTSGQIIVNSQDIKDIDTYSIRKHIAYVSQEPTIFSGTIRSNIVFSRPDASEMEVINVAKVCGVTDFTNNFEKGLDSEIGEKGIRISGGQKQRIAIARALLYSPQLLLLDEATNAMDSNLERDLLSNISKFLSNKTVILITHRLSSIVDADQILLLNNGKIVAQGTHNNLMNNDLYYSQMKFFTNNV